MKLTIVLFLITIFTLYFCYQYMPPPERDGQAYSTSDKTDTLSPLDAETPQTGSYTSYSSRLQAVLEEVLRVAQPAFQAEDFTTIYSLPDTDSAQNVHIEITIGALFDSKQQHCLIRRHDTSTQKVYLDIFLIQEDSALLQLSNTQEMICYQKDSIFDINGDQQPDFVICWYPIAGQWKRDVRIVCLYQAALQEFSPPYNFTNPQFDRAAGIVRGTKYVGPQRGDFYKYQWQGFQLDTLAYIYPHPIQEGKYLQVPNENYKNIEPQGHADNPLSTIGLLLDSLPEEYKALKEPVE